MLKIFWYIFLVLVIALSISWILENNGTVIINWLDHEVQTDVLTAIFLLIIAIIAFSVLAYLVIAILAIKFPELLKFFFKKSYTKKLEKIIIRHQESFEAISQIMLAMEVGDNQAFARLHNKISGLTKNGQLGNFLDGKKALIANDLKKAKEFFEKFTNNKHAKILFLKAKAKIVVNNQEYSKAIAYCKQILDLHKNSIDVVYMLLEVYKKTGMWQEAKSLISEHGVDNFANELQKHDLAVINTAIAIENYGSRKFIMAIKHAKIALRSSGNFVPANEILVKSMIKLGFRFGAILKLRSLWKESPNQIYAKLYEFLYRKSKPNDRIKAMKKLFKSSANYGSTETQILANLYLSSGDAKKARELLLENLSYKSNRSTHFLLAKAEKLLGDEKSATQHLDQGKLLPKVGNYSCLECSKSSLRWSANCPSCGAYDSIEWNF